jgi:hypothetical protein
MVMINQRDQLKTELRLLNGRIQATRNEEVRHALQRAKLEAERTELLVKLVDTPSAITPAHQVQSGQSAYAVVLTTPSIRSNAEIPPTNGAKHQTRQQRKPAGLPTIVDMIVGVLRNDDTPEEGITPSEITDFIRNRWWPDVRTVQISSTVWKLAKEGRLHHIGHRYRLNGHVNSPSNGVSNDIGDVHV